MQTLFQSPRVTLVHADCFEWLESELNRHHGEPWLHAVVTDPPFGVLEFTQAQLDKMEAGSGGVWRIPPSFDGHVRRPLPRFTVLLEKEQQDIYDFFFRWALAVLPALHPGAHVIIASNVLLTHVVDNALTNAGLEKRATLVRLVQTLRGGDRPKLADKEFSEVIYPRINAGACGSPREGCRVWRNDSRPAANVDCRVDVRVGGEPTDRIPAKEPRLRLSIRPLTMPTTATRLAGVRGVHQDHSHPRQRRLVGNKGFP